MIEEGRDGAAGGRLLEGVTLLANGRALVREGDINRYDRVGTQAIADSQNEVLENTLDNTREILGVIC